MKYIFLSMFFTFLLVVSAQNTAKIKWVTIETAEKLQKKSPNKPIFIQFYTTWCGWCKKMDRTTLTDASVVQFINTKFIPVRFDAESKEIHKYKGREYKFIGDERTGMNSFAYWTLNGSRSYPSTSLIFANNDKKIANGYLEIQELMNFLKSEN